MVERERAKGPVLVLDAGNALFKHAQKGSDPSERARAELLLTQLDALGTAAMAVGERDLTLGVAFLRERPKGARLKLLSANLVDSSGQLLFPASTVVEAGGVRFGIIGLSPVGARGGAQGRPAVPAAVAEARRLREKEKVDVVVVLAAIPYPDALEVAGQAQGVDFIAQSGENRGVGMAMRHGFATLVPAGERGRQLARLELNAAGTGPFVDLAEYERAKESLQRVEAHVKVTKERVAATQDATAKQALQSTLEGLEARQKALRQTVAQGTKGATRTQVLTYVHLGSDVASDPALQRLVERIEPPGSAHH